MSAIEKSELSGKASCMEQSSWVENLIRPEFLWTYSIQLSSLFSLSKMHCFYGIFSIIPPIFSELLGFMQ